MEIQWKTPAAHLWKSLCFLFLTTVLAGCASTAIEVREIERIPHRIFDPSSIDRLGVPDVKVRLAADVELAEVVIEGGNMGFIPPDPGSLAIAIGVSLVLEHVASRKAAAIKNQLEKALKEIDLPNKLQESIERRLKERAGEKGKGTPRLEIVIQRYGFVIGPDGLDRSLNHHQRFCPVIHADITLEASDQLVYKDRIFWEPYKRSTDVPPPQCASPSVFAAQEGKLARQTLEEATEVLAAVIVARLK